MTCSSTLVEDAHPKLSEAVQLLHRACEVAWQDTRAQSPQGSLGLGIYLVLAQANALLPEGYPVGDIEADHRTVVQLLVDAERCTRKLPVHLTELAEISELVISMCDLIGEASRLDQ